MIHASYVVIEWDKVVGATGYTILKDGVAVSSTKTALTARLQVDSVKHTYEIRSQGVVSPPQIVTVEQMAVSS